MQARATSVVSLATRRVVRNNPRYALYPGVSWAEGEEQDKMVLVNQMVDDVKILFANSREFDNVQLRFLRVMRFEGTQCLDLSQLANNVRIPIFLRVVTALSYHTIYVRQVTFAS